MRQVFRLLAVLFCLAAPAHGQEIIRPQHMLALLPLDSAPHPDIDALMQAHWRDYYQTGRELAFGPQDLRVAHADLNGDGIPELILMIDREGWQESGGMPMVVAQWRNRAWFPIGWGWGDEDTTFTTTEVLQGWRSLDMGTQWLRWHGRNYVGEAKE